MMDAGRIVLELAGTQRDGMTVDNLLKAFRERVGKTLDNDRMLLAE